MDRAGACYVGGVGLRSDRSMRALALAAFVATAAACAEPHAGTVPVRLYAPSGVRTTVFRDVRGVERSSSVAECYGSCRVSLPTGKLVVHVSETHDSYGGRRPIRLDEPSIVRVTPSTPSDRWVGFAAGAGGTVLTVTGAFLLVAGMMSDQDCLRSCRGDREAGIGAVMFLVGGIAAPVGWVAFGRSFRPSVDIEPMGGVAKLGWGF